MPRWFEVSVTAVVTVLLSPLLLVVAVAVRLSSRGPVLYRQVRVGRGGRPFTLLKFRTMHVGADRASRLTLGGHDPRTTSVGRVLRRTKMDELPQLWNVLRGDMALVGPRPDVPEYVDPSVPDQAVVLRHRPGLTDPASLAFRHEADLLATAPDPDAFYRDQVLPTKLRLSASYLEHRSLRGDLGVLVRTVAVLAGVRSVPTPALVATRSTTVAGSDERRPTWHAS